MLAHYIFVRKDLPLGVLAAMVTHAAGESAHSYADENGHFRGATAVVLEARDEAHLRTVGNYLADLELRYVEVVESSGIYADQLMAIGLVPREKDAFIIAKLGSFPLLKSCVDNGSSGLVNSLHPAHDTKDRNQGSKETPNLGSEGPMGRDSVLSPSGC